MDKITIGKVPAGAVLFDDLQKAARYAAQVGSAVMGISLTTEDCTYQVWYVIDDQTPSGQTMVDISVPLRPMLTLIRGGKA